MRYFLVQYARQPNGQINEQVSYSKRIKENDLQTMNVIIDYKTQKVVKCVIEGNVVPTTFEQMNEYYKEVYPSLITQLEKVQQAEPKAKDGQ
jgi:hypothetical protein